MMLILRKLGGSNEARQIDAPAVRTRYRLHLELHIAQRSIIIADATRSTSTIGSAAAEPPLLRVDIVVPACRGAANMGRDCGILCCRRVYGWEGRAQCWRCRCDPFVPVAATL
jgi:hypothetical protein